MGRIDRAAALGLLSVGLTGFSTGPEPAFRWAGETAGAEYTNACLPAGLRLTVIERPDLDVVSITTSVGVGAREEAPGAGEGAHLLEHLWFRSTPGGVSVWDQLHAMGAHFNGYTRADLTTYATIARRQELEALLELELQRINDPLQGIDQTLVSAEERVVQAERRLGWPEVWVISPQLSQALYPEGHVYHSLERGGSDATLEALQSLAADYSYANTSMVVVGDVDASEVIAMLEGMDPQLTQGEGACYLPSGRASNPPAPASQDAGEAFAPGLQPGLGVAWTLPGSWQGHDAAAEYLAMSLESILITLRQDEYVEGGDTIVLARRAGFRTNTCVVVPRQFGSVLACQVLPTMTHQRSDNRAWMERMRANLLEAGRRAALPLDPNTTYPAELWERGSGSLFLLNALVEAGELPSPLYGSHEAFVHMHYSGRPDYALQGLQSLGSLDSESAALAERFLTPERAVFVHLKPRLSVVHEVEHNVELDPDRPSVLPKPAASASPAPFPQVERRSTENGLSVRALPREGQSQVVVRLRFAGSTATEPKPWAAEVVKHYNYTPWELQMEGRRVGLQVREAWDGQGSYLEVSGSAGNLHEMLWVLAEMVSQTEFSSYSEGWLTDTLNLYARTDQYWLRMGMLLPGHPLGQRANSNLRVSSGLAKRQMLAHFDPANATLEVVGGFETDALMALVEQTFGAWKSKDKHLAVAEIAEVPLVDRQLHWRDRPMSNAQVRFSCRLQDVADADPAAQAVIVARMQAELFDRLREGAGLVYTPRAWIERWPDGPTVLMAKISVDSGHVGQVSRALLETTDSLPGSPEQVELARAELVAKSYAVQVLNDHLLYQLDQDVLYGEGLRERYDSGITALDPAALERELDFCHEHEVILVEGYAEKMQPSLLATDELGWNQLETPYDEQDARIRSGFYSR
ncbi:MAG: insulinase family protein [Myxococcota bacterium]|nr:insulinase family protein [Myxococcota bacterium]